MGYNFNNYSNEYSLSNNLTAEVIDLYGLIVTYVKTTKVGMDKILSEYQYLKADNDSVYKVSVYPENTAGYNDQNDLLTKFGMIMQDTINLYISKKEYLKVFSEQDFQKGVGDIMLMPSGQWFEITDVESQVPGINNMFLYGNEKNVYILKLKPYAYNKDDIVISQTNEETGDEEILDLDEIFNIAQREDEKAEQQIESKLVHNKDPIFGDLG